MGGVSAPTAKRSRRRQPLKREPTAPTLADAVLTIDDLVVYLKLPKSTVYKLAQEGKIPGHKVGKHWRFHRETIDRWLTKGATRSRPSAS
jgi:excisionase family DNA binding protein